MRSNRVISMMAAGLLTVGVCRMAAQPAADESSAYASGDALDPERNSPAQ